MSPDQEVSASAAPADFLDLLLAEPFTTLSIFLSSSYVLLAVHRRKMDSKK